GVARYDRAKVVRRGVEDRRPDAIAGRPAHDDERINLAVDEEGKERRALKRAWLLLDQHDVAVPRTNLRQQVCALGALKTPIRSAQELALQRVDANIRAIWIQGESGQEHRRACRSRGRKHVGDPVDRRPASLPAGGGVAIVSNAALADHVALTIDRHDRGSVAEPHPPREAAARKNRPIRFGEIAVPGFGAHHAPPLETNGWTERQCRATSIRRQTQTRSCFKMWSSAAPSARARAGRPARRGWRPTDIRAGDSAPSS